MVGNRKKPATGIDLGELGIADTRDLLLPITTPDA
jgi:hypothetical protein